MLELIVKEEYALTPDVYMPSIDFDEVHGVSFANSLAVENKRLIVNCHIYRKLENFEEDDDPTTNLLFDLSKSNIEVRNITEQLGCLPGDNILSHKHWRICQFGDALLFTGRSELAKLFPDFGRGDPVDIIIENPFRKTENQYGHMRRMFPNAYQNSTGEDDILPVPTVDNSTTECLSFLKIDVKNKTARWHPTLPRKNSNLTGKITALWGKPKPEISHENIFRVNKQGIPGSFLRVAIQQSMIKDGSIYIYTRGYRDTAYTKGTHQHSAIAKLDSNGNVLSLPYFQDHQLYKDQKKRGHYANFTSSKKFCILKAIYAPADEWKGKQRLFDFDSHELLEFNLPRGY